MTVWPQLPVGNDKPLNKKYQSSQNIFLKIHETLSYSITLEKDQK